MVVRAKRRSARALRSGCLRSTKASQSVESTLSLNYLEISSINTDVARSETSVGSRRRAQPRTPALTLQSKKRLAEPSGLGASFCSSGFTKPGFCPPHGLRRAAKPQGETGGRGGNYFPRIAFPALTFLPPAYRALPSAPDTLYGLSACTTPATLDGGSESRLLAVVGRTARKRPGAPER